MKDKFMLEFNEGLGDGPLTLGIFCTVCNSQYELNNEAVAMAIFLETSFLEYVSYVQSSECPKCKEKNVKDSR
jgi:hypothetical protein